MKKSTMYFVIAAALFIMSCIIATVLHLNYANGRIYIEIAGIVMFIPLIVGLFMKGVAEKQKWCWVLAFVLLGFCVYHFVIILGLIGNK